MNYIPEFEIEKIIIERMYDVQLDSPRPRFCLFDEMLYSPKKHCMSCELAWGGNNVMLRCHRGWMQCLK